MYVLGLQGSPRKKGNSSYLLSAFMAEAEKAGAQTRIVDACRGNILPCKELIVCEKKGYCPIEDDMNDIYGQLRRADVIVAASPIFFYNLTAQLKALIDRCQTLWARKYRFKLKDPGCGVRRGFTLSVAATKGKNLFDGLRLTMQYFFDAVDAIDEGGLFYIEIEKARDMSRHQTVLEDVQREVRRVLAPFMERKKILFVGRENAILSQMAAGFAGRMAGNRIEAVCAGGEPAERVAPGMVKAMAEKGIDMAFRIPESLDRQHPDSPPDLIVDLRPGNSNADDPFASGVKRLAWHFAPIDGADHDALGIVRDEIEKKVTDLVNDMLRQEK